MADRLVCKSESACLISQILIPIADRIHHRDTVCAFYVHDETLHPHVLSPPSCRLVLSHVQMGSMGRHGVRHRHYFRLHHATIHRMRAFPSLLAEVRYYTPTGALSLSLRQYSISPRQSGWWIECGYRLLQRHATRSTVDENSDYKATKIWIDIHFWCRIHVSPRKSPLEPESLGND
jgi:hypothetical protein